MDINDLDSGHYEIHGMYSYFVLQDKAEKKIMFSVKKIAHSYVVFIFSILAIFGIFGLLLILTRESMLANSLILIVYVIICGFLFGCIIVGTFDTLKKISKLKIAYKADMNRIKEKLENCQIYMEIPKEDYEKFNNVWQIISYYRNHRDYYNIQTVTDYSQQRDKNKNSY